MSQHRATVNVPHPALTAAPKRGDGRAFRTGVLFRGSDPHGPGHMRKQAFVDHLLALGTSPSTAFAWTAELVASGMARETTNEHGDAVLVLLPMAGLMARYGVTRSTAEIRLDPTALTTRRYLRYLLNRARARHNERPMARATVSALYRASKTTQRRAEKDEGVKPSANAVRHELKRMTPERIEKLPVVDGTRVWRSGDHLLERLPSTTAFAHPPKRRRRHCPDKATEQAPPKSFHRYALEAKAKGSLVRERWRRGSVWKRFGATVLTTWSVR